MSKTIKIKKGLDIHLFGEAQKVVQDLISDHFALKPTDFHGLIPRLSVQEGDKVKTGTALFYDKKNPDIVFTSPVSGQVVQIKRGAKRVILEIVIQQDPKREYEEFGKANPDDLTRGEIKGKLLRSGIWPVIRQRPYSIIADPNTIPKSIFISGFDSSPLAPDYHFIIKESPKEFQSGLAALLKLTDGKINLNLRAGQQDIQHFIRNGRLEVNYFSGPHPAGNVGVQIHHIDPIIKGETVWVVNPQDVVTIGKLFISGIYDASRIIALTGSEVISPRYYRVYRGTSIAELVSESIKAGNHRYISGNVLTGTKIDRNGFLSFYDNQLTVIPEGNYYDFLGWATPGLKKFSLSRTFFSWLTPKRKYRLDTNLHGATRAIVMTGQFEKVFPFDIYPVHLIKAVLAKDIDKMEALGIYEVDEEDFSLCEFIDTSKMEIQSIMREGLDYIRNEMN